MKPVKLKLATNVLGVMQTVEVVEVEFQPVNEPWSEYRCLDSNIKVKVRVPLRKLYRLLEPDGQFAITAQGEPVFLVDQSSAMVSASEVGLEC